MTLVVYIPNKPILSFLERAAHLFNRVFSFYFDIFVLFVIFYIIFEGGILVLVAFVPDHCSSFTTYNKTCSVKEQIERTEYIATNVLSIRSFNGIYERCSHK